LYLSTAVTGDSYYCYSYHYPLSNRNGTVQNIDSGLDRRLDSGLDNGLHI